jgi:hypothetical protein
MCCAGLAAARDQLFRQVRRRNRKFTLGALMGIPGEGVEEEFGGYIDMVQRDRLVWFFDSLVCCESHYWNSGYFVLAADLA